MIYLFFMYASIECAALVLWLVSQTFLHELCHYFAALSYKKDIKGIIILQGIYNKRIWIKTKHLVIAETNLLNCKGLTVLDDNFCSFKEKQLKVIAITPRIIQIVYFLIIQTVITVLSSCAIAEITPIFYFINLISLIFVIVFSLRKGTSEWNDINIFKNPLGYSEYVKNNLSEDETYNYWRKKLCI